ncbi:helix-turn-helix domain-containing protein [Bradyrhizobium sp. DASA03005]|uniref:AlbA family DNA-binding domain-containing protein n=1 Tax=Bradyrhizobium sp. SPXBL-02 TaxID=3395912 RepID=UPI003F6F9611
MAHVSYRTLADLQGIIADSIPEGVTLEYKGSSVLRNRDDSAICKAVTALANSVGGHFIIGIEAPAGGPMKLDGGLPGPSKLDWIHKTINANTFPPLESVEVIEIPDSDGTYYVISTTASVHAPHQSKDRRYYKRQGSHSEPMEHYEIEDVRSRPKSAQAPLRISLFTEDTFGFLRFRNDSTTDIIKNLKCRVETNFRFERDGIEHLCQRGLRELRPDVQRYFLLDTIPGMLQKNAEAELHVRVNYEFREQPVTDHASFYMTDLLESAIIKPPEVKALNELSEKVEKLTKHLERLRSDTEKLTQMVDGSGLRLSQRTLQALKNVEQFFDPYEFDWDGYKILLDISTDEAISLHRIFGVIDSEPGRRQRYENLPTDLRAKFEKKFRVDFGS